jgi:hypothetical protein
MWYVELKAARIEEMRGVAPIGPLPVMADPSCLPADHAFGKA